MNKALLAVAGVVLTGGIIGMSYFNIEKENEEPNVTVSAEGETQSTEPEQIAPPTERTVETNGEYPWNYLDTDAQRAEINKGGQVYLMSDAEALENQALGFIGSPVGDPENIVENYVAFGKQFANLVADLTEFYPDNQDYFAKLSEVSDALIHNQPELAAEKINEAKALR